MWCVSLIRNKVRLADDGCEERMLLEGNVIKSLGSCGLRGEKIQPASVTVFISLATAAQAVT